MAMHPSRPSCPLVDPPLARSPLGASVSVHTFRLLHLVRCTRYNTSHNRQWPPRYQQSPIKPNLRSTTNTIRQYDPPFLSAQRCSPFGSSNHQVQINAIHFLSWYHSCSPYSYSPNSSHSFTVPHLCTMKPGHSVCFRWMLLARRGCSSRLPWLSI